LLNSEDTSIEFIKRIDLLKPPQYKGQELVFESERIGQYVSFVINAYKDVVNASEFCIIEKQMGSKTQQICCAFVAAISHFCPVVVLHPSKVKKWLGTSTGDHDRNKAAAVAWCEQNAPDHIWQLLMKEGRKY